MAKRRRNSSPQAPAPPPRVDAITFGALALLVVALMISFAGWKDLQSLEKRLEDRLDRIERQASRAGGSGAPAQAPPPEPQATGPDPERVYDIQTGGAPAKGPATAPVVIAEFSDFQ